MSARFLSPAALAAALVLPIALVGCTRKTGPAGSTRAETSARAARAGERGLAPLDIRLPRPGIVCCDPRDNAKFHARLIGTPRPPFMAPVGARNVALGKPVTASDDDPIIGEIEMVTDGDKEAGDGSYVEFDPGLQYVQVDLRARY
ncbi:MAG: hypothetical protein ACYTFI_27005, partial [Planctomycetota bacterium]